MIHFYFKDSDCEIGWVPFKRNCYRMTTGQFHWALSENDCVEKEAHLASVHSEEENEFLVHFTRLNGIPSYFYVGGYKDNGGSKVWTDGSIFDYENFMRPYWRNCTAIISGSGRFSGVWSGMPCANPNHNKLYGVCKKSMKGKFL